MSEILVEMTAAMGIVEKMPAISQHERYRSVVDQAKNAVRFLADMAVVQQTTAQPPSTIESTARSALGQGASPELLDRIKGVFAALKGSIERGVDPITESAWNEIADTIGSVVRSGIGAKERTVQARVTCLEPVNGVGPRAFCAVRVVKPYFGPLFHFYSNAICTVVDDALRRSYGANNSLSVEPGKLPLM